MNLGVGRTQHPIRTVLRMDWLPHLLHRLGSAGAAENARAELEAIHLRHLQATIVASRVNRSSPGLPLLPGAEARAA